MVTVNLLDVIAGRTNVNIVKDPVQLTGIPTIDYMLTSHNPGKLLPNIKHVMLRLKAHYDAGDSIVYCDFDSPSIDFEKFTKSNVEKWLAENPN